MKRLITSILMASTAVALAGDPDRLDIAVSQAGIGTNTATSTAKISGRVIAVAFSGSATAYTNTVGLKATNQDIFGASLTASGKYYPMITPCYTNGAPVNSTTNGLTEIVLNNDKVTLSVINLGASVTNTITAILYLMK